VHAVEDVGELADEVAARLGGSVEANSSTTGRWSGSSPPRDRVQVQAGLLVGLQQVDHGRAAVARVAVHMLEQVQRGGAAAVEQVDILASTSSASVRRSDRSGPAGRRGARPAARSLLQRGRDLGQQFAQRGVGVAQQQGQGAQAARGAGLGLGGVVMGMLMRLTPAPDRDGAFLLAPNRLVSLAPSEQPLPKEKPQPPRTSKAFSAYSRCAEGITKRSS
jgi:hypothetical protein